MKKMSNKIVFFGNEKLATGLAQTQPVIRSAVMNAGFEIEQIVTGSLSELKPHESKLAVLAAYGKLIPQRVLDEFPLGIINVHPSLLPLHRGPTPIEQAMLDGVSKTGVSIMQLTAGMDEGPIYKQKSLQLSGAETKKQLTHTLQSLGAELLVSVLPEIAEGTLKPRQQPHPDRATYSHKISKEDGDIDWHKPAVILERQIRAFAGWPKSRTSLGGIPVVITRAAPVKLDNATPATLRVEKKRLLVGTGQDWLEILLLQPDGKKEMPAEAFLAGYRRVL